MHEYSLVQELLGRVEDEAGRHGATAVRRVVLRVGELAGVQPELLATAFELLRGQTICKDAALQLETAPAIWSCGACGRRVESGAELRCPVCARPAELTDGGEAVLERLELEVP
jgi:hydrogenase nickel incorporation protein HypA/HybF